MKKSKKIHVAKIEIVDGSRLHEIYREIKAKEGVTLVELCRAVGITYDFLYKVLHGRSSISDDKLNRIYEIAEKLLKEQTP